MMTDSPETTTGSGDGAAGQVKSGLSPRRNLPDPTTAQPDEMPFLAHLEELRWRIIKALAGVAVLSIACLFFADWMIDSLLLGPTRADFFMHDVLRIDAIDVVLQNRTITGQFFAYFGTVLAAGLILASPLVVYQAWKFVEPGLYKHEREGLRFSALFATFFLVLGIAFGYLVLSPVALQFFAQFQVSGQILNEFDISRYFSMVLTWTFGAGVLFELPVVVVFLTKLGIVTPELLRRGRRIALVVILVVGALLTPPDPLSQIMVSVPLVLLYELSIRLSALIARRQTSSSSKE